MYIVSFGGFGQGRSIRHDLVELLLELGPIGLEHLSQNRLIQGVISKGTVYRANQPEYTLSRGQSMVELRQRTADIVGLRYAG